MVASPASLVPGFRPRIPLKALQALSEELPLQLPGVLPMEQLCPAPPCGSKPKRSEALMSVSVYYLPLGSQESHFMTIISPGQGTRWVRAVASFFMAPDGFF